MAGGSCSGKTEFVEKLAAELGPGSCSILRQDNYYYDQSNSFNGEGGRVNFDHPDAIDLELLSGHLKLLKTGHSVETPEYDLNTHRRRSESTTVQACPVIFVEGTLILHNADIRRLLSVSVFVECEESLRRMRRIDRDVRERSRTREGIKKQFSTQVSPMHDRFVEPSKVFASIILSQEQLGKGRTDFVRVFNLLTGQ